MSKVNCLNVLLIDDEPDRVKALEEALHALGHHVVCHLPNTSDLNKHVEENHPDIVIIDMDSPNRDTLESMATMSQNNPRPIVFFAEQQNDRKTMADAINAGVSAYIADGLQPDRVKAIMDTAIAHFDAHSALREELEKTRTQLADRKTIEKAKGMLMKHQGCDEEQAYQTLRKLAMDRGQKMPDVARNVIEVLQLANGLSK
ncbi:ANTAR domain-containing response regulator [Neptuniibacter sp.]|uniref:ANTAR domain-containing response regulator n=1 Tax=Neptuniibacter sp. TaxID=1962643 RepID=UPI0026378266|nr:ANTAR domain-containing protein [Neptuniibacter sp.]